MNEYIKREVILDHEVCKGINCEDCPFAEGPKCRLRTYILHTTPSADVTEVRHGKWISDGKHTDHNGIEWNMMHCSVCGHKDIDSEVTRTPFCPWCGARMDGESR